MANITFLCTSGSPMGVTREMLYGRGVGGAEYALISLAEAFARAGHNVTIQNRKNSEGELRDGGVLYTSNKHIPATDVLIVFRVPSDRVRHYEAKKNIFWSTDQFVGGGIDAETIKVKFADMHKAVDKTVCISPFHARYFAKQYSITDSVVIDLGVRLEDYNKPVERINNRLLFASVPDRGLHRLCSIWPRIKDAIPNASLDITSDYRLWGNSTPGNDRHIAQWAGRDDVHFHGSVSREELVRLQLQADYLVYPCIYDELFCVTVAEAQVAGAIPITSDRAALATTNEFGYKLDGDPMSYEWLYEFCDLVIALLEHRSSSTTYGNRTIREDVMERAAARFNWDSIAKKWEELF